MDEITTASIFGSEWDLTNDLSAVNEDEDAIIEILLCRLKRQKIYTWVGPLLLALNPSKHFHHLYDESQRNCFVEGGNNCLEKSIPHIYAVSNRALYRIVHGLGKINQVIVISGESGTGKTFNARKALDFLVAKNETSRIASISICTGESCTEIIHKIGKIIPVISAFSTARTTTNAKSSRHGQLLRLQYEKDGVIRGACIHSFLLERTRLTECSNNFEIFYQLIYGLSDRAITELLLSRDENYAILGESHSRDNRCFVNEFTETVASLEALNITDELRINFSQILALIIHIGNITFKKSNGEGCKINLVNKESRNALKNACSLISLPEYALTQLLTTTLICPQNSRGRLTSYRRDLKTPEDCRNRLFSIARFIYERLFNWLVERVNDTLCTNDDGYNWLGILDIFGFETFEYNGFEQLCINYSTERLQLYFMQDYLELGQREFEEEGLGKLPPPVSTQVYRDRLFFIEEFVFSTFNDASRSPIPLKLSTLRHQLIVKQKSGWRFFNMKNESFVIKHYSCPVEYNVNDLLSKNTDKVPTELSSIFGKCKNKLLHLLLVNAQDNQHESRLSSKKCTALAKLQSSLDSLVNELNKCDSHYVRCARPRYSNDFWAKTEFREQLAGAGIFDALPLAKCRFPVRFKYGEFYKRYFIKQSDANNNILRDLRNVVVDEDSKSSVQLGKHSVFITETFFLQLEKHREKHRSRCAKKIQAFWMKTRELRMKDLNQNTLSSNKFFTSVFSIGEKRKAENVARSSKIEIADSANNIVNVLKLEKKSSEGNFIEDNELFKDCKNLSVSDGYGMKKFQVSHVLSADTGYSSNLTIGDESQLPKPQCQRILHISTCVSQQETRDDVKLLEIEKIDSLMTIDIGKNYYVRNWLNLNNVKKKYTYRAEFPKDSTLMFNSGKIPLFYRNRVLSRRCPVEIPIKFHTRFTCLMHSHCPPSTLKPRGLQDCLSETINSVVQF